MNNKDVKKILGSSLKEIRKARGLTQEQLAELIGKRPNTINRIETGLNFVTCETFTKLCNILKVHPSLLLSEMPQIYMDNNSNYIEKINKILQTLPPNKLRNAYNILLALDK